MKSTVLLVACLTGIAPLAGRTETAPSTLGTFGDWSAAAYSEHGDQRCYLVSRPLESEPEHVRRGDIYVMVTRLDTAPVKDKVSLRIGYPFKERTSAEVIIGSQSFKLRTADKYAWPSDATTTGQLVTAMKLGREMLVRGESRRGTRTKDRFSLLGFTAAYEAVDTTCR